MQHYNLDGLSVVELTELLRKIEVRKAEEQWKETVKRLETEAIDAVVALRELTGRNYQFMLGAVSLLPQPRRRVRVR